MSFPFSPLPNEVKSLIIRQTNVDDSLDLMKVNKYLRKHTLQNGIFYKKHISCVKLTASEESELDLEIQKFSFKQWTYEPEVMINNRWTIEGRDFEIFKQKFIDEIPACQGFQVEAEGDVNLELLWSKGAKVLEDFHPKILCLLFIDSFRYFPDIDNQFSLTLKSMLDGCLQVHIKLNRDDFHLPIQETFQTIHLHGVFIHFPIYTFGGCKMFLRNGFPKGMNKELYIDEDRLKAKVHELVSSVGTFTRISRNSPRGRQLFESYEKFMKMHGKIDLGDSKLFADFSKNIAVVCNGYYNIYMRSCDF